MNTTKQTNPADFFTVMTACKAVISYKNEVLVELHILNVGEPKMQIFKNMAQAERIKSELCAGSFHCATVQAKFNELNNK